MFDNFGHEWSNASCVRGTKALCLRFALKAHASFFKIEIQDGRKRYSIRHNPRRQISGFMAGFSLFIRCLIPTFQESR